MNITIISDNVITQKGCPTLTLAKGFAEKGHRVDVITPLYERSIAKNSLKIDTVSEFTVDVDRSYNISAVSTSRDGITYHLISCGKLYDRDNRYGYTDDALRIGVFCNAALQLISCSESMPDYIFTDTYTTALVPVLLKQRYQADNIMCNVKSCHYVNYRSHVNITVSGVTSMLGLTPEDKHIILNGNDINLTKGAVICAAKILVGENALPILYDRNDDIHATAVKFGYKIKKLRLGIDYSEFTPDSGKDIHKAYSRDTITDKAKNKLFVQRYLNLTECVNTPLVAIYAGANKDINNYLIKELMRCDIQIILLGKDIRHHFTQDLYGKCVVLADRSAITLKNVFSGADFCIFQDLVSECGNPSFISAAYGCIPILPRHRFFDYGFSYYNKLTCSGNGYIYDPESESNMIYTLWDALGIYRNNKNAYESLRLNTMKKTFSVSDSIETIELDTEKAKYSFI